jgi:hypothetical protein
MLIKVNANPEKRVSMKQSAEDLVSNMNSTNADLHDIGRYDFASKDVNLGGKKFQVMIHTAESVCKALETTTDFKVGAVFQIWNGWSSVKSVIVVMSKDQLEDARKNYRGEDIIDADDVVTQAVSALRLHANQLPNGAGQVVEHLAMHCAYNNDGVDGDACRRVWD